MEMRASDPCPECQEPTTRPDVVWFGEVPHALDEIAGHLEAATVFAAIGTSGQVHPAAGFVSEARRSGAHTIEINLARSEISDLFHERIEGPATQSVPLWVERLLNA